MIHQKYYEELEKQEQLLSRKNEIDTEFYNGIYDRYRYPVLTREHAPLIWRYDLNAETNPYFEERLGINAVMNSGAIERNGKFYLVARVEGKDRTGMARLTGEAIWSLTHCFIFMIKPPCARGR